MQSLSNAGNIVHQMRILAPKFKVECVVDLCNLLLKDTEDAGSLQNFREMLANWDRDLLVDY